MAFAGALAGSVAIRAYDVKTDDPAVADAKWADYRRLGVEGTATLAEALAGADLVFSLVTADQALVAAGQAAPLLPAGALFCDLNSVAPSTKRQAAAIVEAEGGRYADVAVMAPVLPKVLNVSLLVSGAPAADAGALLAALGCKARAVGAEVGRASTIKMLRSVMVKGIEALTAECFLACREANVTDEVAASLDASWPGLSWAGKADYNLERMMAHGLRRAAEMDEVVRTLRDLGLGGDMASATAALQRRIGALALTPVEGLEAKTRSILEREPQAA